MIFVGSVTIESANMNIAPTSYEHYDDNMKASPINSKTSALESEQASKATYKLFKFTIKKLLSKKQK